MEVYPQCNRKILSALFIKGSSGDSATVTIPIELKEEAAVGALKSILRIHPLRALCIYRF